MLEQVELAEQGKGVAAGIVYECGATGKRPGAQMRDALKIGETGDKKFAAPYGAIGAGARAVEGDAADCVGQPVLGHDRHNVGMVMLHFGHRKSLVMGPFARQVLGVQVACHRRRRQVKEVFQTRARGAPSIESRAVFDIADMLRHKTGRMTVGVLARERHRGFLLRPTGEYAGRGTVERR